jgi:hypothetical protein
MGHGECFFPAGRRTVWVRGFPTLSTKRSRKDGARGMFLPGGRKNGLGSWFSHPFDRKKSKGWGTGNVSFQREEGRFGFVVFPPFRQKEVERMGHGECFFLVGGKTGWVRGFPTLSTKRSRKDGARGMFLPGGRKNGLGSWFSHPFDRKESKGWGTENVFCGWCFPQPVKAEASGLPRWCRCRRGGETRL